ncbi:hypothetical protein DO72_5628 [Burkholderia pseudomallei]|nr:hypothetical protein DO72_5628 [Burkholderia pseudomallei]
MRANRRDARAGLDRIDEKFADDWHGALGPGDRYGLKKLRRNRDSARLATFATACDRARPLGLRRGDARSTDAAPADGARLRVRTAGCARVEQCSPRFVLPAASRHRRSLFYAIGRGCDERIAAIARRMVARSVTRGARAGSRGRTRAGGASRAR